jgi:hypothetical protein
MPSLQKVQVLLVERGTNSDVDGGSLKYDDASAPRPLPCTLLLNPGNHTLAASHPSRIICQPNPRQVEVVIQTDPGAAPQVVTFEVEPISGDGWGGGGTVFGDGGHN